MNQQATYSNDPMNVLGGNLLINFDVDIRGSKPEIRSMDYTNVSVDGDAIYRVKGSVCGGSGEKPKGYNCPLKDAIAVANCLDTMKSYRNGACVATSDAICIKADDASWRCVREDDVREVAAVNTDTSASSSDKGYTRTISYGDDTTAHSKSGASTEGDSVGLTSENAGNDCTPISIAGDATFCISGTICSGDGDQPAGDRCPVQGDVAVSDCLVNLPSYLNGQCMAPIDSVCQKAGSGVWGCSWNASDNVKSFSIDTEEGTAAATDRDDTAIVVVVVAGMVLTGVIACVAYAWSRYKRSSWSDSNIVMDGIVTPSKSVRNEVFRRV
uniref:Uncharacterized protein n=1 Tax=Peronospora matthiolae TaxID=2874970 RepID=A0AAV1V9A3_9STRA